MSRSLAKSGSASKAARVPFGRARGITEAFARARAGRGR
jgi:hypothetical protein